MAKIYKGFIIEKNSSTPEKWEEIIFNGFQVFKIKSEITDYHTKVFQKVHEKQKQSLKDKFIFGAKHFEIHAYKESAKSSWGMCAM